MRRPAETLRPAIPRQRASLRRSRRGSPRPATARPRPRRSPSLAWFRKVPARTGRRMSGLPPRSVKSPRQGEPARRPRRSLRARPRKARPRAVRRKAAASLRKASRARRREPVPGSPRSAQARRTPRKARPLQAWFPKAWSPRPRFLETWSPRAWSPKPRFKARSPKPRLRRTRFRNSPFQETWALATRREREPASHKIQSALKQARNSLRFRARPTSARRQPRT